jgi:hypothetical protein
MDVDGETDFMFPFYSAQVLECPDSQTRILRGWLQPNGLLSHLCAPRDAVVQQVRPPGGPCVVASRQADAPETKASRACPWLASWACGGRGLWGAPEPVRC